MKIRNGFDEKSLQLAFENVLPSDSLLNGDKWNQNTADSKFVLNGSTSIRQKVKYIPADKFVHIKPPPINTQKIYVKQQNGNQFYTLGVKNISTFDIPPAQNKLMAVTNEKECEELEVADRIYDSTSASDETEQDSNADDINIFDIPILLADNDGNILENLNNNESVKRPEPDAEIQNRSKGIEILSEEIINGTIIGELENCTNSSSLQ